MYERFHPKGFETVYVGAFETPVSCEKWKREYGLPFPVIPDRDGTLFRKLTNGWVPCSILVGPDGRVVFSENEFDEAEFSKAIERIVQGATGGLETIKPAQASGVKANGSGTATVLILGGGAGGLVAANHLRRRLPREHRIILIDRAPDHLFSPSLLWLMAGTRRPERIRRPLTRLNRKGIGFHQADVQSIDLARRVVITLSAEFAFDYLVISLGAELAPQAAAGFSETAHNLYDLGGCVRLNQALRDFSGGKIAIVIPSLPFKCPAAPIEAAFLIEEMTRRKGLKDKTEVHLFTPEHQPMPVAGPVLGEAVVGLLKMRGIHYHPLFTFKEILPGTREIVAADGRTEKADLIIGIPPHQAPQVLRNTGLLGPSGWVMVDSATLKTGIDRIYAIGDAAAVKLPNGKMLPKAGVFAHAEGGIVADEIASEIEGTKPARRFDGKGYCWIELGEGRAGFASGNFFAEPDPAIKMYRPGRAWHWGKVAFEQWWLRRWF